MARVLSVKNISPLLLLILLVLAIVVFVCFLLHFLLKFFIKRSLLFRSNRNLNESNTNNFQSQLQHLFRLHDSGLDQTSIDNLPVFFYKDIIELKDAFECAVCLCEFSEDDKLRLIPTCSHAFHIDCIDNWLLSNSTCPLCRLTLYSSCLLIQNPAQSFDFSRDIPNKGEVFPSSGRNSIEENSGVSKRVFSIRLGKCRSINDLEKGKRKEEEEILHSGRIHLDQERKEEEVISSNLDARRCYSMGTFQYVLDDHNLIVSLSPESDRVNKRAKPGCLNNENLEGKKITSRVRGDSFSTSKTWLWSKKNKFSSSSNTCIDVTNMMKM